MLLSLALLAGYLFHGEAERREEAQRLIFLDQAIALRHLLISQFANTKALKASDLAGFSIEAMSAVSDEVAKRFSISVENSKGRLENPQYKPKVPPKPNPTVDFFGEYEIPGALVVTPGTSRLRPGTCEIALFQGSGSAQSFVASTLIESSSKLVNANQIYLVNFGLRCRSAGALFGNTTSALLIPEVGEKGAIAFRKQDFAKISLIANHYKIFGIPTRFEEEWLQNIPEVYRQYLRMDKEYYLVTVKAIEVVIINLASEKAGEYYDTNEFDLASRRLFRSDSEDRAQVLGVSLTGRLVLRFSPLLVFLITFLLVRRTKTLLFQEGLKSMPWVLTDTSDRTGRFASFIYGISPWLALLIVYPAFAHSVGAGFLVGDQVIFISNSFLPDIVARSEIGFPAGFSLFASSVLILMLIQFILLIQLTRNYFLISGLLEDEQPLRKLRKILSIIKNKRS